jgi:hypothetical protein
MKVRDKDVHAADTAIFGHVMVWHNEKNVKKYEKKNNENHTLSTVIYLYIPTILWCGYAVCHSVPKSTTVPIPVTSSKEEGRVRK